MKPISVLLFFIISLVASARACDPPAYLFFYEDASQRLDSLCQNPAPANLLERMILSHNLAFNKQDGRLKQAEGLQDELRELFGNNSLVLAYSGSLGMIRVSQRGWGSNVLRGVFGKSPYKEARQCFEVISQSLALDSANLQIRFLRATAALESAEHFPEFLDIAERDLLWLGREIDCSDSVAVFFLNLSWVKYHYRKSLISQEAEPAKLAQECLAEAEQFACRPVYVREARLWRDRIASLPK